jgi:hypothetical protein
MYAAVKSHYLVIMFLLISLAFIACSSPESEKAVEREATMEQPERSIDEPVKARRVTEEEYTEATKAAGDSGLVEEPKLPFDIDTPYAYEFIRDGIRAGASKFIFIQDSNGNYMVNGDAHLTKGEGGELAFKGRSSITFDERLRPRICGLEMPGLIGGEMVIKSVDFTAEPFGVEYMNAPTEDGRMFREIEQPEGEIWPLITHFVFDVAIIAACMGPPDESAEVSVLNLVQDSIERFSLKYVRDLEEFLEDGTISIMAKEYEGYLNDNMYGWFYFNADGRMISVNDVGGIRAELLAIPQKEEKGD